MSARSGWRVNGQTLVIRLHRAVPRTDTPRHVPDPPTPHRRSPHDLAQPRDSQTYGLRRASPSFTHPIELSATPYSPSTSAHKDDTRGAPSAPSIARCQKPTAASRSRICPLSLPFTFPHTPPDPRPAAPPPPHPRPTPARETLVTPARTHQ
ncbi:hypothetical protein GCM10010384_63210 [Streptomyces djakartensis]|uniref:Uncharacterized protein n=1 Tax=Streptomyces djakartensis TaxID=68193 RepID=A0ABQ3AEN9_9ACTN|nr:hypothetical protein GCM10010384_63210 [Streptomyces djakartensis]